MKKVEKLIFSVLAVVMLITGCGGGGGETNDDNSHTSSSSQSDFIGTSGGNAKAQLGVLAGAIVKIYELGNSNKLLYTEKTTSGTTIETIGNFNAHEDELDNDKFYLYEVNGGKDWDADDDGIVNENPLSNKGTFRAIVKGSTVKSLGGKITISAVSEILYTKLEKHQNNTALLAEKLNEEPKTIIKDDLNNDGKIDESDIMLYNPIKHEDKLTTIYKDKLTEVIYDIHRNHGIDIAVKPKIKGGTFTISKQITSRMKVGKLQIIDDGQSRISGFTSSDWDSHYFNIDGDGVITVNDLEYLSVKTYNFEVYARNRAGRSDKVKVIINVLGSVDTESPIIITSASDVLSNERYNEVANFKISIKDALSTTIELEGDDASRFKLHNTYEDEVYILSFHEDFENPRDKNKDNIYHFTIRATDSAGNTSTKDITMTVTNAIDEEPILADTYTEFTENADIISDLTSGDIFVGKVRIQYEGDTPINKFVVYGGTSYDSLANIFKIDKDGNVYLNSDTSYLNELNEEDGTRDKAINFRNTFLNRFGKEGDVIKIRVGARNEYSRGARMVYFKVIIVTKDDYTIKPHILSYIDRFYNYSMFPDGQKISSRKSILDISNPSKPTTIDSNIEDREVGTLRFTSDGKRAYTIFTLNGKKAIKILDMQDLKDIKYLGRIVLEDSSIRAYTLSADNKHIYVLGTKAFYIFDTSDFSKPISKIALNDYISRYTLSSDSNDVYILSDNTWYRYDISVSSQPTLVSEFQYGKGSASRLKLSPDGNRGYIIDYNKIYIVDLSDPHSPQELNTLSEGTEIMNIEVSADDTKLYVLRSGSNSHKVKNRPKLEIFDMANISNLTLLSSLDLNNHISYKYDSVEYGNMVNIMKLSPDGKKVYLGGSGSDLEIFGISIIDLSDSLNPSLEGYIRGINVKTINISSSGDTLYVSGNGGLFIMDVRKDSEK